MFINTSCITALLDLNIKLNNCVSAAGSILNHLAKRGEKICASYSKPGTDWSAASIRLLLSCGCKEAMVECNATCRDLNLVIVPNPSAWMCQPTCKKTAAASCKTYADEYFKLWIKVPKDENDFCADVYKGSQIMANSCN